MDTNQNKFILIHTHNSDSRMTSFEVIMPLKFQSTKILIDM